MNWLEINNLAMSNMPICNYFDIKELDFRSGSDLTLSLKLTFSLIIIQDGDSS